MYTLGLFWFFKSAYVVPLLTIFYTKMTRKVDLWSFYKSETSENSYKTNFSIEIYSVEHN